VFQLLVVILNSFRVTICGHYFCLALEPAQLECLVMVVSSSLSLVDLWLVADFACEAGIDEDLTEGLGWWDQLWI
jgi:hypothetical protein